MTGFRGVRGTKLVKLGFDHQIIGTQRTMPLTFNLICLAMGVASVSSVLGQLEWVQIPDRGANSPQVRRDAAIGYHRDSVTGNERIIIFGGRPEPMDDTWIFDLTTETWTEITTTPKPAARYSMVYGMSGDYFYITTGEGPNKIFYNDIWRFNMSSLEWEALPPEPSGQRLLQWEELQAQPRPYHISVSNWRLLSGDTYRPQARYGAAGGIYPGSTKLYLHQGFSSERYFDLHVYDTVQGKWEAVFCPKGCTPYNPSYPHARCLHAGTMTAEDEFSMFGGCLTGGGTGGPCPAGDSWIYNGRSMDWEELAGCATPRTYASMAMLPVQNGQRRAVLYGGNEDLPQVIQTRLSTRSMVAILDPGAKTWTIRLTVQNGVYPVLRASPSMATGTTGIYMFGGQDLENGGVRNDLWLLQGDSASADNAIFMECPRVFTNYILVHGCLMIIGWGIFLLWGAYVARYFNSRGKTWFYIHVSLQIIGLLCGVVGFIMAVLSVQFSHFGFAHGIIGLVITILGILQPLNALVRPNRPEPGEKKKTIRMVWEFIHHFGGRVAILLALANISLGVFVANAHTIAWGFWFGYLAFVIVVFIVTQYMKGCFRDCRANDYKADKVVPVSREGSSRGVVVQQEKELVPVAIRTEKEPIPVVIRKERTPTPVIVERM
ncbi:hypothetical protein FSP39_021480 [Pinctada imbricata]|uniref:Cytochrome b561 domain-containing protein n=1 Tax=Pinctada imbricata TaxID=66713 RepID=A0AA89C7A2_PINIB|nr:hypothetical protein FSP39_021480 [Pinctada imbricata]